MRRPENPERRARAFPVVLLLAAFKLLLLRYSGERDLVVGWPIANREVGNQTLVGPVANLLALRTHLAGGPDEVDPPFRQLLGRVAASTREAWEHRRLPFATLVEALQLPRESSHHPLFQVAFSWREGAAAVPEFAGLEVSRPEIEGGTASFDLSLEVEAGERGLRLTAEIDIDLFDRSSGRRLLEHYRNLLAEVVAAPERRLSEYTLLSAGERQQLLWGWNDTAAAFARGECLHELYAAQAGRTPEAVAPSSLSACPRTRRSSPDESR